MKDGEIMLFKNSLKKHRKYNKSSWKQEEWGKNDLAKQEEKKEI